MSNKESAPTMIIPSGTEIQIDVHGQLSVRTPGNLVIQNSGHYGEIESVHGSIRIESGAEVEAASVQCAETCYVQGSLTSWKVKAKSIQLEEQAQARVVLQETESVEIGKNAKLVGNFDSEKELFLLFSRFARQLRSMPFYFERDRGDRGEPGQLGAGEPEAAASSASAQTSARAPSRPAAEAPPPAPSAGGGTRRAPAAGSISSGGPSTSQVLDANQELPDQLFFALVLLERELKNESYGASTRKVVDELVQLLRARDLDAIRATHQGLRERLVQPGPDLRRAFELIADHFERRAESSASGEATSGSAEAAVGRSGGESASR